MGANIIMKNERNRQMNDILMQDIINYQTQTSGWWVKIKNNLMADTISDQNIFGNIYRHYAMLSIGATNHVI